MLYKETKQLFKGIYQYKIVIVCAGATWFRSGDMNATLEFLKKVDLTDNKQYQTTWRNAFIKTKEDLDFAFQLQHTLSKLSDIEIRVESPWVSIYTNDKANVDQLAKLDSSRIKYICVPPSSVSLQKGVVIMPKVDFEYKITLGKTSSENSAFVSWAESNKKVKLTKSCIKDMLKNRSWGGTHFYITGDKNLLLAKMHLGSSISKVERIIKA